MINRSQIARWAYRLHVTDMVAAMATRPCLIVLCYHRIGDPLQAEFDPGVFSATPDAFCEQVDYYRKTYGIVSLEEALDALARRTSFHSPRVLLTFDDGYRDNYTTAYPILRSMGVQGTFLLATGMVGENRIPWWDTMAFLIRNSRRSQIRIPRLSHQAFDLEREGAGTVMRKVLRLYRGSQEADPAPVIEELAEACGTSLPQPPSPPLTMSWDEAREMHRNGMAIGSHSHSHRLMSALPASEQKVEVELSHRRILEEIGEAPRVFAVPCGCAAPETRGVVAQAGYEACLLTDGGVNSLSTPDPLSVVRVIVDYDHQAPAVRLRLALNAAFNARV